MSARMFGAMWKFGLPTVAKIIMLKMGDNYNEDANSCWPSVSTIAHECDLSVRSVQRYLKQFIEDGAISVQREADGRGHPRHYDIHLGRCRELYPMPKKGEPVSPFFVAGKGERVSPMKGDSDGGKGDSDDAKGDSDDVERVTPGGGGTLKDPLDEPSRGREGAAARGAAPSHPPACAVWRENWPAIEARLGEEVCKAWMEHVIPDSDDGEVLTLAAATRFIRDHVESQYAAALGEVLGRRVEVVTRGWVSMARARMDREAAAAP